MLLSAEAEVGNNIVGGNNIKLIVFERQVLNCAHRKFGASFKRFLGQL